MEFVCIYRKSNIYFYQTKVDGFIYFYKDFDMRYVGYTKKQALAKFKKEITEKFYK